MGRSPSLGLFHRDGETPCPPGGSDLAEQLVVLA